MSEKLCLQWNDFEENIKSAFGNSREGSDFKDVTLVYEDEQQVEDHMVILAASSPFFKKLLGRNKHPHPLILMRGKRLSHCLQIFWGNILISKYMLCTPDICQFWGTTAFNNILRN